MQERIRVLQQLLDDPTGNLLALGVALTIAVLLVVIFALLLLVVALPKDRRAHTSTRPGIGGKRLASTIVPAVVLGVGVLASLAVWYQSTSTIAYCTRTCHAMAEPAQQWRESAHTSVSCIRCHEGRLWRSFPRGVMGRSYSIYLQVSGATPKRRPVSESICLSCHEEVMDLSLEAVNGEFYIHRADIDAGRQCISCHGKQGHVPR